MKLNPFSGRQEPPQSQEFIEVAAPTTRHPWLGEDIAEWDNEEYEAIQVDGRDKRGATVGYYLRHRASQTLVGRIRPDRSK